MALPVVRDYMDKVVPTLSPETDILEAVDFLLAKHVTGAPVLDPAGNVIGILTEKDCLRLLSTGHDQDKPRGAVRDYMTKEVISVPSHMNVYFLAGMFLTASYRRLPVIDSGKLVGAITRFDVLRVIQANLKTVK